MFASWRIFTHTSALPDNACDHDHTGFHTWNPERYGCPNWSPDRPLRCTQGHRYWLKSCGCPTREHDDG